QAALVEGPARAALADWPDGADAAAPAPLAATVAVTGPQDEQREYLVTAAPLRAPPGSSSPPAGPAGRGHDASEGRRLLAERQARAEADARRALLQLVIAELPSGVYLVRGRDGRLVLANRAAMAVWGAEWPEGLPMADFLARSGTQIVAANGRPLDPDELATTRAVRGGAAGRHHQEIIRRDDGTALPILLNAVALDAGVFGALGEEGESSKGESSKGERAAVRSERAALVVFQDVTALKEAEHLKDEFIAIAA